MEFVEDEITSGRVETVRGRSLKGHVLQVKERRHIGENNSVRGRIDSHAELRVIIITCDTLVRKQKKEGRKERWYQGKTKE